MKSVKKLEQDNNWVELNDDPIKVIIEASSWEDFAGLLSVFLCVKMHPQGIDETKINAILEGATPTGLLETCMNWLQELELPIKTKGAK